ncbi:hypothetical protein MT997_18715 [Paenibacillus sp. OVF10]|nr:hypothetical protein MT997_18715 [Paenibacillus sp. OVF10]
MKKWRKRLVKFLIFDLAVILLLLGTGVIYQQVGLRQDAKILVPLESCTKSMETICIYILVEKAM